MVLAIAGVAGAAGFASVSVVGVVYGGVSAVLLGLELLCAVVLPGGLVVLAC